MKTITAITSHPNFYHLKCIEQTLKPCRFSFPHLHPHISIYMPKFHRYFGPIVVIGTSVSKVSIAASYNHIII